MASEEDHAVYGEDDLDEDDDDESEEEDLPLPPTTATTTASNPPQDLDDVDVDDDVEIDEDDDDTSSSNLAPCDPPPSSSTASQVTVAVATPVPVADPFPKHRNKRIDDVTIAAATVVVEEKKPLAALDDSRRLFQRLWTDEDEIELLQGFLDYTNQRGGGGGNSSSHHHDTAAFYDQIKSKLQLDFNKNQLVEKLRRLKKKYRNVVNKIESGKDYVFKSPHDQATFEISRKIWNTNTGVAAVRGVTAVAEEPGLEDDEPNPNPNLNSIDHNNNGIIDPNSSEKKGSRSRKRSRVKIEEKNQFDQQIPQITTTPTPTSTPVVVPNLIEETVKSCLSPLFKELIQNAMNNNGSSSRGFGGVATLNPMPLSFGGPAPLNFTGGGGDTMDERWRKQQILELEVYSKRLELVQDQIKSALEELRSMGN